MLSDPYLQRRSRVRDFANETHLDGPHSCHANVAWTVAKNMTSTVYPELPLWAQSPAEGFAGRLSLCQEIQPSLQICSI
jgi:hypothetical protein